MTDEHANAADPREQSCGMCETCLYYFIRALGYATLVFIAWLWVSLLIKELR